MSEEYPKYQFINYDTHYITFRKYLDKLNYIDIDFPYEELEYTLNKARELQDRINKAIEYMKEKEKQGTLWFVKSTDELFSLLKGDKEWKKRY